MNADYLSKNLAVWQGKSVDYATWAAGAWASEEITWGFWPVPESQLRVLPEDLAGLDVIELGCGTAYFSGWLARRGARPVGIDLSPAQLATARAMQTRFDLPFPLIEGNAEHVPLPDASFDLAISEYGASIWCDPYAWVPEAARLLRPGGTLAFLVNGLQLILTTPLGAGDDDPATEQLQRPSFGLHSTEWEDGSVSFTLEHGRWIRLLRENGFEVIDLHELQAPEHTTATPRIVTAEWGRQWPAEEIWVARKR
ncbi:class I SAM-dependent methyltransferase [Pseudolysinimonas yzui]|uniref:class I SAM-dependent methyltransferase n=1 Tax=Pseudolysinimonas yzui TaxID=2708254 RepID=UPI001E376CB7|nr:class I SAM-dependent methyltransferase [Pseudolysinimonas yzui]